jgi:uncharacterized Zn finger protein
MELARLLAQLDDSLLGDLFSASALTRARAYVGRVRHIEVSGNQLQALVQGNEPRPTGSPCASSGASSSARATSSSSPAAPARWATAASTPRR